jgi:hypothetical protein
MPFSAAYIITLRTNGETEVPSRIINPPIC